MAHKTAEVRGKPAERPTFCLTGWFAGGGMVDVRSQGGGAKRTKLKRSSKEVCMAGRIDAKASALRFPVVSLSAEYLTIGYLMRRNILAYKAPQNNEGYDLICIHPDPTKITKQVRVQVKSRYQTDSDRAFPVKAKTFPAFDYLIVVFLNIGYFYRKSKESNGTTEPEFYTLSNEFIRANHRVVESGFDKVPTKSLDLTKYKNGLGFELIAESLGISYPSRP
jgi:hypothetical protein